MVAVGAGTVAINATLADAAGEFNFVGGVLTTGSFGADGIGIVEGTTRLTLDCAAATPDNRFTAECPLDLEFKTVTNPVQSGGDVSGIIVSIRTEGGDLAGHALSLLNPPADLTDGGIEINSDDNIAWTSAFPERDNDRVLSLNVQLTDGVNTVASVYILTITPPDLALVAINPTGFTITAGQTPAVVTVSATGGYTPRVFRLEGAPSNLTINAGGVITVTVQFVNPGTHTFAVVVEDNRATVRATLTLEVLEGLALAYSPANILTGRANQLLARPTRGGGTAPYTYSFGAGALGNLAIDSASGVISVNAAFTAAANHRIPVMVVDSSVPPMTAMATLELSVIESLVLSLNRDSANVRLGRVNVSLASANPAGGLPPYTYSLGGAPRNITINSTNGDVGVGAAFAAAGNHNIVIIAVDNSTPQMRATATLSLTVLPAAPPEFSARLVPSASVNTAAGLTGVVATMLAESGAQPYQFSLGEGAPANVAINAGGDISIASAFLTAGNHSFAIIARDSDGAAATLTLAVAVSGPALSITPVSANTNTGESNVSLAVAAATGGAASSYTYSLGEGAPGNLTINADSGEIRINPAFAAERVHFVQVIVRDNNGGLAFATLTV
ncbi:MAG: cadherin repeat domain-containing protein, partial [Betaproteobacteria bacterium]|nr:cadherin repeat domain-containing protein [Betaproteobacteria bacterium]